MIYQDFNRKEHGFAGHLAAPDSGSDRAVIVIMGGEHSLLPGIKIAQRFADYGLTGLAVSLFGADGIPDAPDRCPVELFEAAVNYLRHTMHIPHISIYGQSMGTIFAVLTARYVDGIESVILVSPTHVAFEGTTKDRKHMTGHSIATWRGADVPFVRADFSGGKSSRYQKHPAASHPVMGMWVAFYNAYQDKAREREALLPIEQTGARILLIAGGGDEAWPSEYSVNTLKAHLERVNYSWDVKAIIYPNVSHLTGMMPNKAREKWLYRMIPLIGLMYRSFGTHRAECLAALEQSEQEIINWLNG